jgi:hypothetical protein
MIRRLLRNNNSLALLLIVSDASLFCKDSA